jgi:hypothetical protein
MLVEQSVMLPELLGNRLGEAGRDIARTPEIPDGCLIARRGEGLVPSPRMGNYFTKRTTIKNVNSASDSINATPISIAN